MTIDQIIQTVNIVVLSLITIYYAYQTKRQADLLSKQVGIANRQQENELLNEIIEWSTECAKAAIKLNHAEVVQVKNRTPRYLLDSNAASKFVVWQSERDNLEALQHLRAQSAYIENIIPDQCSIDLVPAVQTLIGELRAKLEWVHNPELVEKYDKLTLTAANEAYLLNIDIYADAVSVSEKAARAKKTP